jgi:hypothetical protein
MHVKNTLFKEFTVTKCIHVLRSTVYIRHQIPPAVERITFDTHMPHSSAFSIMTTDLKFIIKNLETEYTQQAPYWEKIYNNL